MCNLTLLIMSCLGSGVLFFFIKCKENALGLKINNITLSIDLIE